MKKIKIFLIHNTVFVLVLLLLFVPFVSFAQTGGLVPCGTINNPAPCGFKDFMTLINNVIDFIFKNMVIPIAAIMFFYAGFLMVTAGGEAASARTKAKSIFTNALIGLVIAAAAWLIVKTILTILDYQGPEFW